MTTSADTTPRDPHIPGSGQLAPTPEFLIEPEMDVDGDGRETPTGWLIIVHPELDSDYWGETCGRDIARFEAGDRELAEWVVRALNDRAAYEEDQAG